MGEQRESEPISTNDVFYVVVVAFVLLFLVSMADSCHAGWRYRDLRDRLERLEQRK